MRRYILAIILIFNGLCFATPPALTKDLALRRSREILAAHVRYKEMSDEVISKTFIRFIEELDPTKTYFTKPEIEPWLSPSDERIQSTHVDFHKKRFTQFECMFSLFLTAIERRNTFEQQIQNATLPKDVSSREFKDLDWASDSSELKERLIKIRALQTEAAEKIEDESLDTFFQRLEKRRRKREEQFTGLSSNDQEKQLLAYYLKALSGALDAHTAYLTPSEANQFLLMVQQSLVGIGAQLRDDLNGFTLTRLLEGGPALRGGILKIGDRIIAVNQEPVVGMDITEAVERIRGPQNTPVTLTILREETRGEEKKTHTFDTEVIRDEIVLQESRFDSSTVPYADGVIAHLRLYSFYQDATTSSAKDIEKALDSIQKEHKLKGVILDLRNNSGGLLTQAVAVSGLFLKKGIIVSVKDSSGAVSHQRNFTNGPKWSGPLLTLTNVGSASASEIVAQALQDYGRAFIIGDERTFGKGTYQTFTLGSMNGDKINPQGEFKVTRGLYYTVSGKSPQLIGAKADIVVPGVFSELDIGEKHSRFPLPNESIPEHFCDNFEDVNTFQRAMMLRQYGNAKQQKITTFTPHVKQLQDNSAKRIASHSEYQKLLTEIKKKDCDVDKVERYSQSDLQFDESVAVMKDFIALCEAKKAQAHH